MSGVPSALRRIIASHIAKVNQSRFAMDLLPFNLAVGVKAGMNFAIKSMQLAIERYIQLPQSRGECPLCAAVFFDFKNMFNVQYDVA